MFAFSQSGSWLNVASASGQTFTFTPTEITLDPLAAGEPGISETVRVTLDNLPDTVVANTVQVTVVHDDTVYALTGAACVDLYAGAFLGTNRIASEGATSIVCSTQTAPTDTNADNIITGDVIEFTLTRLQDTPDATLSLLGTGPWQTDVIDNGSFVGGPVLGTLSVLTNHAPVADAQAVVVLEDGSLPITLTGSDTNNDTLTFAVGTGPANGSLSGAAPNLTYTPNGDYNGADSFTFTANDGQLSSTAATVSITVTPVNDQPVFISGGNQSVLRDAGAQTVANWATGMSPGPADEAAQLLTFSTTGNTNPALFTVAPSVDAAGTLTYTPDANTFGTSTITITLTDDGGTADGGVNALSLQFDIETVETRSISGPAGTVSLAGMPSPLGLLPQVSVIDASTTTIAQVSVNADGSFSIPSVPADTYTIRVELLGFQTAENTSLVVGGGEVVMAGIELGGGFVNADASVDGFDLSIMLGAFGTSGIVSRIDGSGNVIDMNGDGNTTALDINHVTVNFGTTRTVAWATAP